MVWYWSFEPAIQLPFGGHGPVSSCRGDLVALPRWRWEMEPYVTWHCNGCELNLTGSENASDFWIAQRRMASERTSPSEVRLLCTESREYTRCAKRGRVCAESRIVIRRFEIDEGAKSCRPVFAFQAPQADSSFSPYLHRGELQETHIGGVRSSGLVF